MANVVTHKFVSEKADSPDTTKVNKTRWNDEHAFAGGAHGSVLVRDTGETDGASWVAAAAGVLACAGAEQAPAFRALVAEDIPQLAYSSLSGLPTLGSSAALNVGTTAGTVAAGDHTHTGFAGLTLTAPLLVGNGLVSAPSLASATTPGNGWLFPTTTSMGAAIAGSELVRVNSNIGLSVNSAFGIGWSASGIGSSADTILSRRTAAVLRLGTFAAGVCFNASVDGTLTVQNFAGSAGALLGAANLTLSNVPTSDPAVAGRLWSDSGTLKISAG